MSEFESEFGAVAAELAEWNGQSRRVRLHYTERYGNTLNRYTTLADIAKRDFPDLKDEDITPITLGGTRYSRLVGIEFNPGKAEVPTSYRRVGTSFPHAVL